MTNSGSLSVRSSGRIQVAGALARLMGFSGLPVCVEGIAEQQEALSLVNGGTQVIPCLGGGGGEVDGFGEPALVEAESAEGVEDLRVHIGGIRAVGGGWGCGEQGCGLVEEALVDADVGEREQEPGLATAVAQSPDDREALFRERGRLIELTGSAAYLAEVPQCHGLGAVRSQRDGQP